MWPHLSLVQSCISHANQNFGQPVLALMEYGIVIDVAYNEFKTPRFRYRND